jgi:hypothetical protein
MQREPQRGNDFWPALVVSIGGIVGWLLLVAFAGTALCILLARAWELLKGVIR